MIQRMKQWILGWLGEPTVPFVYHAPLRLDVETDSRRKRLILLTELAKLDPDTVKRAAEIFVELSLQDLSDSARPRQEGVPVPVVEVDKACVMAGRGLWETVDGVMQSIEKLQKEIRKEAMKYG